MMKKILVVLCTLYLIIATKQLSAQDEASMKAWMTYMTPGDIHKMLAESDGEWKEDITMWMAPGAPPTKSIATAVNKMIMGGRYQQSMHTGSFNGMPFEGMSLVGYDNSKKVFMSSWVDNMGTGVMQMEGTWDPNTKTINFVGNSIDPMTGKDMKVRQTYKIVDKNTEVMEMFMTHDGKESKSMEIKLTRK